MKNPGLLVLIMLPLFLHAQTTSQKADAFLTAYTNQHKFSGVVLIAKNDTIIFNNAYGFADVENKKPNTTTTEFRAGSLTKMFTSNLILQLAQQGRIGLNDAVSKYIPAATWADNITIKNLLSHTSGIHGSTPSNAGSMEEMVEGFKPDTTVFSPDKKFAYNNFNYILLSYIAEKVTGISYPELIQKMVLHKAGLMHSGIDYFQRKSFDKAFGYTINPSNNEWVITGNDERIKTASGAGALYTTTGDLFKWSQYISNKIATGDSVYINAVKPVMADYGLGWISRTHNGHAWIGHTGTVEGFNAMLMLYPSEKITIIYLSNFQDINVEAFEKNLVALVFNETYEMPVEKKAITLSPETLKEYIGTFGEDAHMQLNFFIENNALVVLAPGGDKLMLTATAKDKFFMKGPDIEVNFNRENNIINSISISMGNQTLKKIK